MTAIGFNDAWDEMCLVGIMKKGGSEVQYAGIIEDISGLDFGDKDIEVVATLAGGRIVKRRPQAEESLTLKVYPVSADLDGSGFVQLFHPQSAEDTSDPIEVSNTRLRNKYRVILLWASTLPAAASTQPEANASAYRIQIFNAYLTQYKPSFDGKEMTAEIAFKWAPFDKAALANKIEESTDGSAQLSAASAYA